VPGRHKSFHASQDIFQTLAAAEHFAIGICAARRFSFFHLSQNAIYFVSHSIFHFSTWMQALFNAVNDAPYPSFAENTRKHNFSCCAAERAERLTF